jgi:hypothetical protein
MFPPKDDSRQQWLRPIRAEKIEGHSVLFRSQDIFLAPPILLVDAADRAVFSVEVCGIVLPRQPVHAGGGGAPEREERLVRVGTEERFNRTA